MSLDLAARVRNRLESFGRARATRLEPALYALSVLVLLASAFSTVATETGPLPRWIESTLWLGISLSLARRLARNDDEEPAPRGRRFVRALRAHPNQVIALAACGYVFFAFRLLPIFHAESAGPARSRVAAELSRTAFGGVPFVALGLGVALWFVAETVREASHHALVGADELADGAPRLLRVVALLPFVATILLGSFTVLGYATGSWSLVPE